MNENVKKAVQATAKWIDDLSNPRVMTVAETKEFLEELECDVEARLQAIAEDERRSEG
jgi:hypothetical protein